MGIQERRIREKAERRATILDAARTLLFKEGISGTSVHQIAKMTELSVGTIYLYFRSKEEIFATLQEEGLDILKRMAEDAGKEGATSTEKLIKMAESYFEFSSEQKKYFDIFNYFISAPKVIFPPPLKSKIDAHGKKILGLVEKVIESGIASGEFNEVVPKVFALSFWGTMHGLIQFRKFEATLMKKGDFSRIYTHTAAYFINGICKKPTPPAWKSLSV